MVQLHLALLFSCNLLITTSPGLDFENVLGDPSFFAGMTTARYNANCIIYAPQQKLLTHSSLASFCSRVCNGKNTLLYILISS